MQRAGKMHTFSTNQRLSGAVDLSDSIGLESGAHLKRIESRPPYLALPRGLTGFDVMALGSIAQLAHEDANVVRDIQACLIAMREVNAFGQIATRHMTRRGNGHPNQDDLSQARAAFAASPPRPCARPRCWTSKCIRGRTSRSIPR